MERRERPLVGHHDQPLVERALANMAAEYAARHAPDGAWVEPAAWLVTARSS